MTVTVRPCRASEHVDVLNLWLEAEATPSATDDAAGLARLTEQGGGQFLVAEEDGSVVGTIIARWDGWRGNMYRLAVLPGHRRSGAATALVREAERLLALRSARRLSILIEHEDPRAGAFWDSLEGAGYERDPRMSRIVKTA